jgi:hypothetical protein
MWRTAVPSMSKMTIVGFLRLIYGKL